MGQGYAWSRQVGLKLSLQMALLSSPLFSVSHCSCLKGTEIEQRAIKQQVWSYLRPGTG